MIAAVTAWMCQGSVVFEETLQVVLVSLGATAKDRFLAKPRGRSFRS